jgi:DNA polymerase-3 subunit alpha
MRLFTLEANLPGNDRAIINFEGETQAAPCVMRDSDDFLHLIVVTPYVYNNTWEQAYPLGISVITHYDGRSWNHLMADAFVEQRQVEPGRYFIGIGARSLDHPTPFRQLVFEHEKLDQMERAKGGFVNVHTHTEFSALDGLSKVEEIVKLAKDMDQPALAVTDHGICAAHPHLQIKAREAGIKPVFGLEAYFVNDRLWRPNVEIPTVTGKEAKIDQEMQAKLEEAKAERARQQDIGKNGYYHLILWAMTTEGLHNLWAMSTAAHREGFYYRARMDWEVLERLNTGIMASTACLRGPLSVPLLADDEELAVRNLARLQNVFGDRLYIELHANQIPEQVKVNHGLITLAQRFSIPLVAAVDSHYPCREDRPTHQTWLALQTKDDIQDENDLFARSQEYHLMDRAEVCNALEAHYPRGLVSAALDQTVALAERCDAEVVSSSRPPIFSKPTPAMRYLTEEEVTQTLLQADVTRLMDICLANWDRKVIGKTNPESVYRERFEKEMLMYIDKKFCGYFDIVSDYTRWSKEQGWIMGPSRGSGGACLVAYLADIIEIDPIEADLPLARFMTPGRVDPPDFDLDWPTTVRTPLQTYVAERWGEGHVVRVGTHTRLKNKGVFRSLAMIYKSDPDRQVDFRDLEAIIEIIRAEEADSAGLGKPWDVVYLANEDVFAPYVVKYPWLFDLADKLVGRLKSYGRHAAGMVISTENTLTDWLPMRMGEDGHMISDFDMEALEKLHLLKFDLLTLRTLDTLQECIDLIHKRRPDARVDIYSWAKEMYQDPLVWEGIRDGYTMGLFQVETPAVTGLIRRIQPNNLDELADVITLVRPGPTNSGLTNTYIRRKFDQEPISVPDPRLVDVLSKTYGCIVYQEDIINVCRILAGYDEEEADAVRKVLGKKKIEQVTTMGQKFIPACVERGMDKEAAESLWHQMAEFSKYSFNRAHAYAYAVLCYWTAWFKFHYTPEFLTSVLSTADKVRIPDFVNEARRMHFKVLPPDINESGKGFTAYDTSVRYALDGIKGVGDAVVEALVSGQPYASFEDFLERKGKACNDGHVRLLAEVGVFDSVYPHRHELEVHLNYQATPESTQCVHLDRTSTVPNGLPCGFDWSSEPVEFSKTGKPKKAKPLPTKCFKGCRRYTAPPPWTPEVDPYTPSDIQDKEMEHLGVWLSSTPFDRIPPKDLEMCHTADSVVRGPLGPYLVAAIIEKVNRRRDRYDNEYAWVKLFAQTGSFDTVCWSKTFDELKNMLREDILVIAYVNKKISRERETYELTAVMPV